VESKTAGLSVIACVLILCVVPPPAAAATPSDGARAELRTMIENVREATGSRYGVRDSAGRTMDTAKITQDPAGGYLAVYHSYRKGVPRVSVATSADLLTWTFRHEFGSGTSQPAIAATSDGGFVVAWEQEPDNHLAFRYFRSRAALLAGTAARSFDAPRSLSSCAEGTPNIYSVTLSPDIDHSTIDLGGHYYNNCDTDRQQRGRLVNFSSWSTSRRENADNALLHWGVRGNIGDRDKVHYKGYDFDVMEGQHTKGDFGTWRTFVYDHATGNADRTSIVTRGGSTAFANPTVTSLTAPNGQRAIVVTLFLPSEGAASSEAGTLIYYRTY
jgi:hypothetical protein